MVSIDWDDIQGNVLRGYGFDHGHHLVFTVTDAAAARRWLGQLVPAVTPGTPWRTRPVTTLNLAFTHRGLAALGLDRQALASFPPDFREGMRARAEHHLGDVGVDNPDHWEPAGLHHPGAHILLMVHASVAEAGETHAFLLASDASDYGLQLVANERLGALSAGRPSAGHRIEHFGFVDGASQPAVEGALPPTTVAGHGTPLRDGGWRAVRAGEFVLGLADEDEPAPPPPAPAELTRNGSYLVYRKLAQDVAAFRAVVADLAHRHQLDPALLGAKLVGRYADGRPLLPGGREGTGGRHGDPGDGDDRPLNDFRYRDDPRGAACPVGSHIRRSNPRDGLDFPPELVSRHRLLRRGMPYGPPLPPDATGDDGVPRGLIFVAYCANIGRQFEFVQRHWLNDGNGFGAGYTPDPVSGHGAAPRRFVLEVPDRGLVFLDQLPRLVRLRGGDYLFQPAIRGLRYLAAGP